MKEISRVKAAPLLICVVLCVALPACRSVKRCDVVDEEAECIGVGPEMLNTRIELVGQPDLRPSNTIWMHGGGALVAEWDTHTFFISFSEVTCDFSNFTEATDDCWVCDLCDVGAASQQRCPWIDSFATGTINYPSVVFHDGFMPETESTTILALHPTSGCSARGSAPVPFTPANNGTYQLLTPEANSSHPSRPALVEKKVFVIQDGMPQTTTYQMEYHGSVPGSAPPTVWYKWTVLGDPVWEDNFSESVRAGKVRILTGRKRFDPVTGRFRLEDERAVRPSRIVLIPIFNPIVSVFNQDANRCYADASKEEGNIFLTGCRTTPGGTGFLLDTTPTYLKTQPTDQLTWVAEFNPNEGADFDPTTAAFDPVPANAVLGIEFTIEKVP